MALDLLNDAFHIIVMQSVANIIDLWPSATQLAQQLDVPYATVSAWKVRQSIPAAYWQDLVVAANRNGYYGVTLEALAELHGRGKARGALQEALDDRPETTASNPEQDAPRDLSAAGHFSRFRHLRRSHFASSEEISAHVRALRDEWDRR